MAANCSFRWISEQSYILIGCKQNHLDKGIYSSLIVQMYVHGKNMNQQKILTSSSMKSFLRHFHCIYNLSEKGAFMLALQRPWKWVNWDNFVAHFTEKRKMGVFFTWVICDPQSKTLGNSLQLYMRPIICTILTYPALKGFFCI